MKTNELIETGKALTFFYHSGHPAARISVDHRKDLVILEAELVSDDLFLALTKYALTPKQEREEIVYYRLLLDAPAAGSPLYFCKTKNGIGGTNLNV